MLSSPLQSWHICAAVVLNGVSQATALFLKHTVQPNPLRPSAHAGKWSQDMSPAQVAADGGPHVDLRNLCKTLKRQGYSGVECSVRVAAALNAPAGEFAGLLNVRACSHSTFFYLP